MYKDEIHDFYSECIHTVCDGEKVLRNAVYAADEVMNGVGSCK